LDFITSNLLILNYILIKYLYINYSPSAAAISKGNTPSLEIEKLRLNEVDPPSYINFYLFLLSIASTIYFYIVLK
jgi:hypothetical protein